MPEEKTWFFRTLREMLLGSVSTRAYNRHGFGGVLSYFFKGIFEELLAPFSLEERRGAQHRDIPATIIGWLIAAIVLSGLIYVFYVTEARGGWTYLRHEMGW